MLDLNLFQILVTITKTKNIQATATLLKVSRSSVSRALAELRNHYKNELFVVTDGYYYPTQFTTSLLQQIQPAILDLELAMNAHHHFDIRDYDNDVTIFASPGFVDPLATRVHRQLLADKTKFNLTLQHWHPETLGELGPNKINIGVTLYPIEAGKHLIQHKIGTARLMVICKKNHPLANLASVDIKQVVEYPLIKYARHAHHKPPFSPRIRSLMEQTLNANKCHLMVSSFTSVIECVDEFDYIHITSAPFKKYIPDHLALVPLSLDGIIVEIEYGLIYHRAWYQHPILDYFEKIFQSVDADMMARQP